MLLSSLPGIIPLFCLGGLVCWTISRRHRKFFPGPTSRPVVGNILSFPLSEPWSDLTQYKKIYGTLSHSFFR